MADRFYSYSCDLLKRRPHKFASSRLPPSPELKQLPLAPVICRHRCKTAHQAYHQPVTATAAAHKFNHDEEECKRMRNHREKPTDPREEYYSPKQQPAKQKPYALEFTRRIKMIQSREPLEPFEQIVLLEENTNRIFPSQPATILQQFRLDKLILSTYRRQMCNSKESSPQKLPKNPDEYNLMNTYLERAQQICDSKKVWDTPQPKNEVLVTSIFQQKQGVESNSQESFNEGFESGQHAARRAVWSKPPLPGKNVYERVASLSRARKGSKRPYSHNQVRNSLDVVTENEIGDDFPSENK